MPMANGVNRPHELVIATDDLTDGVSAGVNRACPGDSKLGDATVSTPSTATSGVD